MKVLIQHTYLVEVPDLEEGTELARTLAEAIEENLSLEAQFNNLDKEELDEALKFVGWSLLPL